MKLFRDDLTKRQAQRVRKWIKALRSGKYEQGNGALLRQKEYCCLGVACEISNLGKWEPSGIHSGWFSYMGSEGLPSLKVQQYYGLKDPDGEYNGKYSWDETRRSLQQDNDIEGHSFKKIARRIELELEMTLRVQAKGKKK